MAAAAFAFDRVLSGGHVPQVVLLYLGLVVAHDLVLLPLYAGVDRLLRRMVTPRSPSRPVGIPLINHVRAPLLISALLLLIYSPLISGLSSGNYFDLSGHPLAHFLRNWLMVTAALFLGSGIIYSVRVLVGARVRR